MRPQSWEREIKALKDEIEKLRENEELETQKLYWKSRWISRAVSWIWSEKELTLKRMCKSLCSWQQCVTSYKTWCSKEQFNDLTQKYNERWKTSKKCWKHRETEKRQWASLQVELNWKYCHIDAVKSVKRVRNKRAHPEEKLTEEALRVSVQKMTEHSFEEGDGRLSVRVVNELISMWKQLKEKH